MMHDKVRETLDKLGDTIVGEMEIVRDLINDRDRWKHRAKRYQRLCRVLLVTNVAMVGSQVVRWRRKNRK